MATPHPGRKSQPTDTQPTEPSTLEVGRRLTEVLRRAANATALPRRTIEPDAVMILVDDELAIIVEPDPIEAHPLETDPLEADAADPVVTFG